MNRMVLVLLIVSGCDPPLKPATEEAPAVVVVDAAVEAAVVVEVVDAGYLSPNASRFLVGPRPFDLDPRRPIPYDRTGRP